MARVERASRARRTALDAAKETKAVVETRKAAVGMLVDEKRRFEADAVDVFDDVLGDSLLAASMTPVRTPVRRTQSEPVSRRGWFSFLRSPRTPAAPPATPLAGALGQGPGGSNDALAAPEVGPARRREGGTSPLHRAAPPRRGPARARPGPGRRRRRVGDLFARDGAAAPAHGGRRRQAARDALGRGLADEGRALHRRALPRGRDAAAGRDDAAASFTGCGRGRGALVQPVARRGAVLYVPLFVNYRFVVLLLVALLGKSACLMPPALGRCEARQGAVSISRAPAECAESAHIINISARP